MFDFQTTIHGTKSDIGKILIGCKTMATNGILGGTDDYKSIGGNLLIPLVPGEFGRFEFFAVHTFPYHTVAYQGDAFEFITHGVLGGECTGQGTIGV